LDDSYDTAKYPIKTNEVHRPFSQFTITAIFGIKLATRGSAYSVQSTSCEMQTMGHLGDLGALP